MRTKNCHEFGESVCKEVDPITLSVVRGVLETTQREMTLALEQTARSSVFNLAHDYSTALFNHTPEMILQGQDIPIHLGSLIPAMKSVANFFEGDILDLQYVFGYRHLHVPDHGNLLGCSTQQKKGVN